MQRLLLLFFFCLSSAFGAESGIELHFIQPLVNSSPGAVVTLQAEIINHTAQNKILVGHLELPPFFEAIPANNILIHLGPHQRSLQNIQVRTKPDVATSQYPIALRLFVQDNPNISATDVAAVIISEGKRNIRFELTSPPNVNAEECGLLFFSAIGENVSDDEALEGVVSISVPKGWQPAPSEPSPFCLEAKESKLFLFGVKVPDGALAGEHAVTLSLKVGDRIIERSSIVTIRSKKAVKGVVEGADYKTIAHKTVHLLARYVNEGNVPIRVAIDIQTEPFCPIQCNRDCFEIPPNESVEIPLTVECDAFEQTDNYDQFVLVRIIDTDTGEQLYQNPMTLKFSRKESREEDPYIRIPGHLKAYVMRDRYKTIGALEFAGGGYIDDDNERFMDFFFRLPTSTTHLIFNIEQQLYVGLYDPEWNLRLGDSVYNLTTLTQYYRWGRGAELEFFRENWQGGIHYTQNSLQAEQNPREMCSYLEWFPNDNMSISANYLHKTETKIPTSNIVTLDTSIELPTNVYTEIEFGKNFLNKEQTGDNKAYRVESHGKLNSDSWFSFEKAYAGPSFYGYYNNVKLLTSSIDLGIDRTSRLNLNYSKIRQNLGENPFCDRLAQIPKQESGQASLTYRPTDRMSVSFNAFGLRARDDGLMYEYDFNQIWGGTTLFYSWNSYATTFIASFGQQKDYLSHRTIHNLQRYNIFFSKEFSPRFRGTLFYDGGNTNYYDPRPWRNGFGAAFNYRFHPRGNCTFFFQKLNHNCDDIDLSQVSLALSYTLENRHLIEGVGQYFQYKRHYPNDALFMLTYTIPLDMPINLRRDVGHIEGTVYNPITTLPIQGALVACQGQSVETNSSGQFRFPMISKGEKSLELSYLPDSYIATEEKTVICLAGGTTETVEIEAVPSASIRGEVIQYTHRDLSDLIKTDAQAELVPEKGLASLQVAIHRPESSEIYTAITNQKGVFRFPKLRPGKWHVRLFKAGIGPLHEVEENDFTIDLSPDEDKVIFFKVLPKKVEVYRFE